MHKPGISLWDVQVTCCHKSWAACKICISIPEELRYVLRTECSRLYSDLAGGWMTWRPVGLWVWGQVSNGHDGGGAGSGGGSGPMQPQQPGRNMAGITLQVTPCASQNIT